MKEKENAEVSDIRRPNTADDGRGRKRHELEGSETSLDGYITIMNIQYSRPPSKKICKLAISTFERMKLSQLKMLEKLNEDLKEYGKISTDELILVTSKIITEVWKSHDALESLLNSDRRLALCFGKEMLVLFDNVMTDPVYAVTRSGKSQRYTKSCLDNSIRPLFEDDVPENRWNTYETVISTYTSPTAFTPEMESLIRHATRLGISTENCNLKNFATERSMTAFLKKLIHAKLKKEAFMKKFNNRLMGVLSHTPNPSENAANNRFKYSLSKIYQNSQHEQNTKSTPDLRCSNKQQLTGILRKANHDRQPSSDTRKRNRINNTIKYSESNFGCGREKYRSHRRCDPGVDSICRKCHEPFSINDSSTRRSLSDSCLSVASCDSIDCLRSYDVHKMPWGRRHDGVLRPALMASSSSYKDLSHTYGRPPRIKSNNEKALKRTKHQKDFLRTSSPEETKKFSLLTEQRSFFRLGEGALRDSLNEYLEAKNRMTNKKTLKKKRVRWSDEPHPSLETLYGSLFDFSSTMLVADGAAQMDHLEHNRITKWQTFISHFIGSGNCNQPHENRIALPWDICLKKTFTQAVLQATVIALVFWLAFVLYFRTPEIALKLKNLRLSSVIIRLFNGNIQL